MTVDGAIPDLISPSFPWSNHGILFTKNIQVAKLLLAPKKSLFRATNNPNKVNIRHRPKKGVEWVSLSAKRKPALCVPNPNLCTRSFRDTKASEWGVSLFL